MSKKIDITEITHEEEFAVKPVQVQYRCEFCNNGYMEMITDEPFSEVVLTNPPMIKHRCNVCGKTMLLTKQYPYIKFVPK